MISAKAALHLAPPRGWKQVPFWSLFRRTKVTNHPDEELLSVYRDHGVVLKSSREDNFNKPSLDLSGYQLVEEGALVTNKMKAWQGSIAVSRHRGIVSPAYYVYQPTSREHDQFIHYLLRSGPYISLYQRISKGIRVNQWDLEHEALRTVPVLLPNIETQTAIADFLDRETARIDQLIKKKERLVEVLAQKEEAVLRSWFEGAEADHGTWKLAHVALTKRGRFNHRPRNDPALYGGREPFLQTGDVAQATKYITRHKQTLSPLGAAVSSKFPKGTVLMSIAANVGDVAITTFDAYCPDSVVGFVPSKRLSAEFLYYSLRTKQNNIGEASTSNAQDNTNIARLSALRLPIPDRAIQESAVDEFAAFERKRHALCQSVYISRDRLREFRAALITAAVTGQIDVKTWGNRGTTDRRLDQIEEEMSA